MKFKDLFIENKNFEKDFEDKINTLNIKNLLNIPDEYRYGNTRRYYYLMIDKTDDDWFSWIIYNKDKKSHVETSSRFFKTLNAVRKNLISHLGI